MWSMQVHLKSLGGEGCADVYYPSLECGGVWHCDPESSGGVVVGREAIAFGLKTCITSGHFELRLSSDSDHAEWSYKSADEGADKNNVTAYAQLQRRQTREPEPLAPTPKTDAFRP
jgi:hypothetical protein